MQNTKEQYEILMATARSYLMLAKSLKESGLNYEHYVELGKKCCIMAKKITEKDEDKTKLIYLVA
jgi:hypothetical protein